MGTQLSSSPRGCEGAAYAWQVGTAQVRPKAGRLQKRSPQVFLTCGENVAQEVTLKSQEIGWERGGGILPAHFKGHSAPQASLLPGEATCPISQKLPQIPAPPPGPGTQSSR